MEPITIKGRIESGVLIFPSPYLQVENTDVEIKITPLEKTISCENIVNIVGAATRVSPALIVSKSRKKELVFVRQIAAYLCKKWTIASLKEIGLCLGGRDHSTVIHSIDSIEDQLQIEQNKQIKPYTNIVNEAEISIQNVLEKRVFTPLPQSLEEAVNKELAKILHVSH